MCKGIYLGNPVRRDVSSGNIVAIKIEPAGGTRMSSVRCLSPDGAFDILSNGFAGGSIDNAYVEMSTWKQWYVVKTATAVIGAADTSFTLSAAWPYPTQTYTATFSNGITRAFTLTNASTASGTFTALGVGATASIAIVVDSTSVPAGFNWAARYPSGSGLTNFKMDIEIIDNRRSPAAIRCSRMMAPGTPT